MTMEEHIELILWRVLGADQHLLPDDAKECAEKIAEVVRECYGAKP
ncbi:MAG TPA: hypothetical protein VIY48_11455 [Candidatus Paceibacterota bacterium]